jgi:hypothetical protein
VSAQQHATRRKEGGMEGDYKKKRQKITNNKAEVIIIILGFILAIAVTAGGWWIRLPYTFGQTEDGFAIRQFADSHMPITISYTMPSGAKGIEYYEVAQNRMSFTLKSVKYQGDAAPKDLPKGKGTAAVKDGWTEVNDIDQPLAQFVLTDPARVNCHVDIDGTVYDLSTLTSPGQDIYFYVSPLYKSWFQKKSMNELISNQKREA